MLFWNFFALLVIEWKELPMKEFVEKVEIADAGQRLDTYWQSCLDEEGVTRSRIQAWIRMGRARINGQLCLKPATRLIPGQLLSLVPEFSESTITPQPGPLAVLFADEHIVIINKDAGLTVHPAPSVTEATLVHRVAHYFPALLTNSGERPGVVHRLDKDTSGLIVMALSESARLRLSEDFAGRRVVKEYLALVAGVPQEQGTITLALGRHPTIKTRMAVCPRGGRPAQSEYVRLWTAPDKSASLVRVRIFTGRTHQIRVHMAAIGHPLLGDAVYADKQTASRAPRQMLHAWHLGLDHPHSKETLDVYTPPPADFEQVLRGLCRRRICLGLTGVAGSGKSSVIGVIADLGVPVFLADQAVAASYAPGGPGCEILAHHFGEKFLAADGGIDKKRLFAAMQESDSLRREVERLIHPVVRQSLAEFRARHSDDILVAEIPLLGEAGFDAAMDVVAVVFCPEAKRQGHLQARGWSVERIARIDSWQWSQEKKLRLAHLVMDNSGSLDDLVRRTKALVSLVRSLVHEQSEACMGAYFHVLENPSSTSPAD